MNKKAARQTLLPEFDAGADIVLDYLWGLSAERLLIASAPRRLDIGDRQVKKIAAPEGAAINFRSRTAG
jgi:hypothetical protein